jgi:hypothetical protein
MSKTATDAGPLPVLSSEGLGPLPEPEHEADTDGCTYACPEGFSADQMRAYAAQAVAAEREACAKVCDRHAGATWNDDRKTQARLDAAEIRERSNG